VTVEFLSSLLAGDTLDLRGGGLRGGRWSLNLDVRRPTLKLHAVEYLSGVRVSGEVRDVGTRRERASLEVSGPRTPDGVLRIGRGSISGELGGERVRVRAPRSMAAAAATGSAVTRAQLLRLARRLAERPPLR
jgi:hypothetical protein